MCIRDSYNGRHVQSLILSHNYLNNRNLKYRNNDDSSEDNLTLRLRSPEQKTTLRFENQTRLGAWTLKEGAELNNSIYTCLLYTSDKEAIRVISTMPKWKPGEQRGKPVRCKFTVPVMFKLQ